MDAWFKMTRGSEGGRMGDILRIDLLKIWTVMAEQKPAASPVMAYAGR